MAEHDEPHSVASPSRPPASPRRRARWHRTLAIAGGGVLALSAAFLVSLLVDASLRVRLATAVLRAQAGPEGRVVVAVVGLDRKSQDPGRTDTIMVISLDPEAERVGMLWVPRDTRVRVPGLGTTKINALYTARGPQGLMGALSDLLGTPINGFVRVDFEAFVRFVDAIGGVELQVERPMRYVDRAQQLYIDLPAGRHRLYGRDALDYVRFRADGLGDVSVDPALGRYYGRIERQQRFVRAALRAAMRPSNLWAMARIARELYALVESDLPAELVVAGAVWLASRRSVEVVTDVLPGMPETVGHVNYWVSDRATARSVARRVLGGAARPDREGGG